MESQLNDIGGKTVTKREINQRVKTQLQRLIPNLAENLTFNSLSPPSSFKKGFYSREPFKETGSWYSLLYRLTNQSYSNNLKGVFEIYNEAIRKHNQGVIAKADKDKTNDYDDELFPLLEEDNSNRSYWTHASGKGTMLAFIKKGVFSNWLKMMLKNGEFPACCILYICNDLYISFTQCVLYAVRDSTWLNFFSYIILS